MITSVTIDRLRGIKHGHVAGLTGLSILVGPNGCGKSTVLDALLIGGSPTPGDAVGRAVKRRIDTRFGLRWLFWRDGADGPIAIAVDGHPELAKTDVERMGNSALIQTTTFYQRAQAGTVVFHDGATNHYTTSSPVRNVPPLRLIESLAGAERPAMPIVYTEAKEAGRAALVLEMLTALVPDFGGIEILSDADNMAVLRMNIGGLPLPVTLAGEGISALVRTVLELAICADGGTALLEEPEVHQHPRTIRYMASGICESVARGVQIVVTTHSLELIDALLHFAGEATMLDKVSVHLVRLRRGELTTTIHDGETARLRIQEIGEDLR